MTEDLGRILHNHEGVGVRFFNDKFNFGDLCQSDDHEQDFFILTGEGAGTFQKSCAPAHFIHDGFGDFVIPVGNDHDGFFAVESFDDGIRDPGADKE